MYTFLGQAGLSDGIRATSLTVPILVTVAVVVLLLYPAMVLRRYVRIMINILDDLALPDNGGCELPPLVGEEVSFRAVDGHRLTGTLVSGKGTKRGAIIFAHEFGRVRSSCVPYCEALWDAGFDVLALDFRGHGDSAPEQGYRPRQFPSDRERADMLGAIAYMELYLEQQGRPGDIGLFGISRGAGAAILASVGMDNVRALVTDGAFSSDSTLEYMMSRFARTFARIRIVAENHPPLFWRFFRWLVFRACARKFRCRFPSARKALVKLGSKPILLVHGEKDSYIPVAQSQELYACARGPKELWIVDGAAHNRSVRVAPKEYARRIVDFFGTHLCASVPMEAPAESRVEQESRLRASQGALVGAGLGRSPAEQID